MKTVTVHAAKTNLSRLIEQACSGEEIVIARGSVPVARLVPIEPARKRRQFGSMRGRITVPDSLFDPLPPEELDAWEQ